MIVITDCVALLLPVWKVRVQIQPRHRVLWLGMFIVFQGPTMHMWRYL